MNFAAVAQGLELTRKYLRPILQVDRTFASESTSTISWIQRVSGINRDLYYPLEYQYLLDHAQYSFLLRDSSFLQMFYRFDEQGVLAAARLAYFPRPLRLHARAEDFIEAAEAVAEAEDVVLFEHLYNWYEAIDERRDLPLNTSHLRFDFDSTATTHAPSHLQFGAMQDLRISSNHFPLPLAFVDLIRPCLEARAEIEEADLAHARNHCHSLAQPSAMICVRTQPA